MHAKRRAAVFQAIEPGLLVLSSHPVHLRNNDVDHEYRQDSDLFYLSGFDEPETVLVLWSRGKERKFILFVRPRDPTHEVWDGRRHGVEGAKQRFGADEAYPITELFPKLAELMTDQTRLYYRIGRDRAFDDRVLQCLDRARARGRQGHGWPTEIVDPGTILHEMRRRKEPEELDRMRRAAQITCEAHLEAMRIARPGGFEYELDGALRGVFRRRGAERVAYQPIVGAGLNATTLHYRTNQSPLVDGELVLIDAACEFQHYAADVTRTFPVNGRFSPEQRAVYEIVLASQIAGIEAARPGKTIDEVHQASLEVLVDGLVSLGVLEGERSKLIEDGAYRPYYMHRTSHYLGMDVHDVGTYHLQGKPRPLDPGVVITVEPGLYFSDQVTGPAERFRGIGIRIEDDILVTDGAPENLSAAAPTTIEDIERACRA
jgi:Xaa-Pro aminopeptidase